ncbi:hypothetical protein CsSME_00000823 [Camellia sinensis var. sinensis]
MFSSYHAAEDGEQLYMRNSSTSKQRIHSQRCAVCSRYLKEPTFWIIADQEWI